MPYKGIDYLKRKLVSKRSRVQLRYKQYAMKHSDYEVGITIPPEIRQRYKAVGSVMAVG